MTCRVMSTRHWTQENKEVTPDNMKALLNRFGGFWNMSKPVLLEKSPPNAILSRYLQALYNVGNQVGRCRLTPGWPHDHLRLTTARPQVDHGLTPG